MKSKGEILKQIDEIKLSYSCGKYKMFTNFDIVIKNFDYLIEYFETNDLWEKTVFGVNESLFYICAFVITVSCAEYNAVEELTSCEKYCNFIDDWFRENYDKYCNKRDACEYMIRYCGEDLSHLLKKRIGHIYFIIMYLNNKNYGRLQD